MISIFTRDDIFAVNVSNFPDGETITRYAGNSKPLNILWQYESDNELMALAQLYSILRSNDLHNRFPKNLYIPYLPHARQDRAATKDTCNAVGTFVSMLNHIIKNSNTKVFTLDVHSSTCIDIFETYTSPRYHEMTFQYENIDSAYFASLIPNPAYDAVICPDNGALRRTRLWWNEIFARKMTDEQYKEGNIGTRSEWPSNNPGHKTFINCTKNRDPETGKLSNPSIDNPAHVEYLKTIKRALLVDDIGTGFGTHIQLGNVIKTHNPNIKLDLFVSHSSFTRGLAPVLDVFDTVYTTDSLPQGNNICSNSCLKNRVIRFNCINCVPEII